MDEAKGITEMDQTLRFSARNPNLFTCFLAAFLPCVFLVLHWGMDTNADHLLAKCLLVAALVLISADCLETITLGTEQASWRNPDCWVKFLFYGWYLALALCLLGLGNDDNFAQSMSYGWIGGAIFGLWMVFFGRDVRADAIAPRWQTDQPMTATRRNALWFRVWPLAVVVVCMTFLWVPQPVQTVPDHFWLMGMLAFVFPLYPAKPGLPLSHNPLATRLLGIALLVAGTILLMRARI